MFIALLFSNLSHRSHRETRANCDERVYSDICAAADNAGGERFITAAALVNQLVEAQRDHSLSRVLARWSREELIVIHELGYLPLAESPPNCYSRSSPRGLKKPPSSSPPTCPSRSGPIGTAIWECQRKAG